MSGLPSVHLLFFLLSVSLSPTVRADPFCPSSVLLRYLAPSTLAPSTMISLRIPLSLSSISLPACLLFSCILIVYAYCSLALSFTLALPLFLVLCSRSRSLSRQPRQAPIRMGDLLTLPPRLNLRQCKRIGYLYGTWVKESDGGCGIAVHSIYEPKQVAFPFALDGSRQPHSYLCPDCFSITPSKSPPTHSLPSPTPSRMLVGLHA